MSEARTWRDVHEAAAWKEARGSTHCSECKRKLRPKVMHGWAAPRIDWLNHRRSCLRYGQAPDTLPAR